MDISRRAFVKATAVALASAAAAGSLASMTGCAGGGSGSTGAASGGEGPVSYTHLTLPTNSLV